MHILKEIVTKKREILARKSTEKNTDKQIKIAWFLSKSMTVSSGKVKPTKQNQDEVFLFCPVFSFYTVVGSPP